MIIHYYPTNYNNAKLIKKYFCNILGSSANSAESNPNRITGMGGDGEEPPEEKPINLPHR